MRLQRAVAGREVLQGRSNSLSKWPLPLAVSAILGSDGNRSVLAGFSCVLMSQKGSDGKWKKPPSWGLVMAAMLPVLPPGATLLAGEEKTAD